MNRTWSPETIRRHGFDGGGIPAYPLHVINIAGDDVVWDVTGEVRTVASAGSFVLRYYKGSTTRDNFSCDLELVGEERTGR